VEAGKASLKEGQTVVVVEAEEAVGVVLSRNVPGTGSTGEDELDGTVEEEGVDKGSLAADDVT
jgi:hypothetical protein